MRPAWMVFELVVVPNAPAMLDHIVIGTKIQPPPGEGWELEAILISEKCTRWVRCQPARLKESNYG